MSLDLLLGFTGLMSLGHAAFFGLGAYAVAMLGLNVRRRAWIGLLAGMVLAGGGAAVIGFFGIRMSGIPFLMLTLAFSQLLFSVAIKWRDVTGGSDGHGDCESPASSATICRTRSRCISWRSTFFVLVYCLLRRLLNAPLGHDFVGIRENEQRMRAIGYPTQAFKLLSFTIAGALAGCRAGCTRLQRLRVDGCAVLDPVRRHPDHDHARRHRYARRPGDRRGVFLLMKNVVSSYSEYWLAIIGITFICCVMFFPRASGAAASNAGGGRAMNLLRLDALQQGFGNLVVTDELNLAVDEGERHVLIGPNGAGKTSLINQSPASSSHLGPHLREGAVTSPAGRRAG